MVGLVVTIGIILLAFGALFWYIQKKFSALDQKKPDDTMLEWIKSTQDDLRKLRETLSETSQRSDQRLNTTLQQNTKEIHDRLTKAAEVIGDLKREAGAFSEIGRSMKDLQEFLRSPKLRGNIGEQVLHDLMAQMLPRQSFQMQYKFRSGVTVDAILKTDAGILPIDSKFPMENFQRMMKLEGEKERDAARKEFIRDVKKHIESISSKYILPEEGTMDFALMYIPSEAVFYEIANENELNTYSRKHRIFVVSPTTMYMHLQAILIAYEGKKIASKSREVFRILRAVQQDYERLHTNIAVLGRHVTNAYSNMTNVSSAAAQLGKKLEMTHVLEEHQAEELPEPAAN